jgi:hypothetical protein
MQKVIYCVGVALLTFSLGAVVYYFTRLKLTSQPVRVVQVQPIEVRKEKPASTVEIETPVEPPAPAGLSVVIKTDLGDGESGSHTVKLSKDPVVLDDLDVPEYIDGQEISIVGGDKAAQFRILERYRTSMTVMGEGPHLDLSNWRHYDSEWITLDQLSQRKFRTLATEKMDASKFPSVTKSELLAAVRKHAYADWPEAVDLAKTCKSPHDEPCGVGVSSLYFRIEKQVGDRWIKVGVVEVLIPMGC